MQKFVSDQSACPVEGLLEAKHLLAEMAKENGKYYFNA
jgi:hypothetical protein